MPSGTDLLGWASSFVLLLTVLKQLHKQWKDETSEGVSKWLYLGQLLAEVGFVIYSWLLESWVFVVTNALLFVANVAGILIVMRHRRRAARRGGGEAGAASKT